MQAEQTEADPLQPAATVREWHSKSGVVIYGMFGGWNAGDEAILYSDVAMLRDSGFQKPIHVALNRQHESHDDWYRKLDVDAFSVRQWKKLFSILRRNQLLIGGGQMITGDKSMKGLLLMLMMVIVNRLSGHRPVMIGTGAEGVKRWRARFVVGMIIRFLGAVGCRDAYTMQHLRPAVGRSGKLHATADVVFSGAIRKLATATSSNSPRIVVAIHNSPLRSYGSTQFFIDLIREIRRELPEATVSVAAHDMRERFDAGAMEEIRTTLADDKIEYCLYESLPEFLELYARSTVVVSARMHPIIIGLVYGKLTMPIADSNKVKSLATEFELETLTTEDSPSQHVELLKILLASPGHDQSNQPQVLQRRATSADENMALASHFHR